MFRVLVSRRKRRVWSSGTIAVSVVAHLILLAGVLSGKPPERVIEIPLPPLPPEVTRAQTPTPPPPARARVDRPPTLGRTKQIDAVVDVPKDIPPVDVDDTPVRVEDYSGDGPVGDSIGTPPETPTPPTGGSGDELGCGSAADACDPGMVEELPAYRDPGEAARMLRRAYPAILAQAGVTGRTVVQLVIDREGQVVPGSVQVVSTTHQGFGEAAVKAVEKIRFRPARINGLPVSVSITMPVDWTLEN